MNTIDCKGLKCPQPVINTKKYFDSIEKGEAEVIVDNEVAKNNLSRLCDNNGLKYSVDEKEGLFHIKIVKYDNTDKISVKQSENLVILVSSDKLGAGDDTLGSTLMKSYMYALSESDKLPKDLLFINSGVNLVTEDSAVLESLKKLSERGVYIASCGVCLDFYGIKERLAVGEITNMYTIIDKMNSAGNTIRL
jgi:selenium metabolism protein YedF